MNPGLRPSPATHLVAAALLIAYGGVAARVVRDEGRAHRGSLQPGPAPAEPLGIPPAATLPEPPAPAVASAEPPASPAPPASMAPARQPATPEPAPPAPAVASTPEPAAVPAPEPAPAPDSFWTQEDQKKVWDPARLTGEDERRLGAALNRMVLKVQRPVTVGPLPRRVEEAAEPFLKAVARKDVAYTVTVLDSDVPNAFSHPGGFIYVSRALCESIPAEKTYALEFAVGHEIAHVDLGHAAECLRDREVRQLKAGTVTLFYALLIPFGYRPDQELAADRWAYGVMTRAGRSKRQALNFLRGLEMMSKEQGFENAPMKPQDEPAVDPLDNHLRGLRVIPRNRLKALLGPAEPAPSPR